MAKPKLTVKEAKLVKAKAEGKKHDEAWDEAGYSQNSSKVVKVVNTSKILSKPKVQEALQAELEKQGITLEKALKPIADGLEADKPGWTDKDGVFHEGTRDHSIRLKASGMALDLMGVKQQKDSGTTVNNFGTIVAEMKDKYAD